MEEIVFGVHVCAKPRSSQFYSFQGRRKSEMTQNMGRSVRSCFLTSRGPTSDLVHTQRPQPLTTQFTNPQGNGCEASFERDAVIGQNYRKCK